ncbi:MAG: hypothetical protein P8Q97_11450 [Myxococcota bacterium]|nr:hypothetical protein [Myxococcota bacterium]
MSPKSWRFLLLVGLVVGTTGLLLIPDKAPDRAEPGIDASSASPAANTTPALSALPAPPATEPDPGPARSAAQASPLPPNVQNGEEGALSPKRTAVRLYGNARVKPLYDLRSNKIDGVEISAIEAGSFWEDLGVDEGDVVVELNGQMIDSPEASVELMNQFSRGYVLNLRVRTAEGRERFIDYRTPLDP